MRKLTFALAITALVVLSAPGRTTAGANCATVITTDVVGNCVVEATTTCCNGLPDGAIDCITTTRNIFCSPLGDRPSQPPRN